MFKYRYLNNLKNTIMKNNKVPFSYGKFLHR